MAETQFGQGCTQFSGAGRILQKIHQKFQFKGQTRDRINQRQCDLAVGRATGDSLVTAPVLHMPNFELPFVLTTDASAVSVGGILE